MHIRNSLWTLALSAALIGCESASLSGSGESAPRIPTAAAQQRIPTTFTVTGCDAHRPKLVQREWGPMLTGSNRAMNCRPR